MQKAKSIFPTKWAKTLCILAGLYAVAVAAYIYIETGKPSGGRDFHAYWYAGHFVIQRHDPYAAFYDGDQPALPIRYLDGVTVNEYPVAQTNLEAAPTNTPVMILLLSPFSYFSWNVAKHAFVVINLFLMLVTGWIVLRLLPFAGVKLSRSNELLLFLAYFDLSATRIAIENGQTTLTVFLFMLLALLWAKKSWQITGFSLGIALSKYSLSLPVFLFFVYKRKLKILLLAISVQVLGVLGLAAIAKTSPIAIVMENVRLFFDILNQPGVFVNLSSILSAVTQNSFLAQISVFVMSAIVFTVFFLWLRGRKLKNSNDDVMDFHILTILFLWTILVGYHRIYDTLILIFFFVLVFKGFAYPNIWRLRSNERILLIGFVALTPLIMILPDRLVDKVIHSYYGTVSTAVSSALFIVMLIISMFLTRKYMQIKRTGMICVPLTSYPTVKLSSQSVFAETKLSEPSKNA
jgi:hypothetical protein